MVRTGAAEPKCDLASVGRQDRDLRDVGNRLRTVQVCAHQLSSAMRAFAGFTLVATKVMPSTASSIPPLIVADRDHQGWLRSLILHESAADYAYRNETSQLRDKLRCKGPDNRHLVNRNRDRKEMHEESQCCLRR